MTLIEILLVISLMAMIGMVTYQALSSGLRAWGRGQQLVVEADVAIVFDRWAGELRNAFVSSQFGFEGDAEHVVFPTVIVTREDRKKNSGSTEFVPQIGQVSYEFDRAGSRVLRREANYSQALDGSWGLPRVMVSSVSGLIFRYGYLADKRMDLKPDTKQGIPDAVEVTVEFREKNGATRPLRRLIALKQQFPEAQP